MRRYLLTLLLSLGAILSAAASTCPISPSASSVRSTTPPAFRRLTSCANNHQLPHHPPNSPSATAENRRTPSHTWYCILIHIHLESHSAVTSHQVVIVVFTDDPMNFWDPTGLAWQVWFDTAKKEWTGFWMPTKEEGEYDRAKHGTIELAIQRANGIRQRKHISLYPNENSTTPVYTFTGTKYKYRAKVTYTRLIRDLKDEARYKRELAKYIQHQKDFDKFQDVLGYMGTIPVVGEPIDVWNAMVYAYRGKNEEAAWSVAGVAPAFLGWLGTGKKVTKLARTAKRTRATGAKVFETAVTFRYEKWAEAQYALFRKSGLTDCADFAKNTGITAREAKTLKKHMMFGKHLGVPVPGGGKLNRFTADPETAFLWGQGLKRKLSSSERAWLRKHMLHEFTERAKMAKGLPYLEAHGKAMRQPNTLKSFTDWLEANPRMSRIVQ